MNTNLEIGNIIKGSTIILGVMLTLILRSTLDVFFSPLLKDRTLTDLFNLWPPSAEAWLQTSQFLIFLILLGRFYWGAYRFNEEQPPDLQWKYAVLNLVGTFFLFCFFYINSLALRSTSVFYAAVFLVHIADFLLFLVVLGLTPILHTPLRDPVIKYILWDVITIVAFLLLVIFFGINRNDFLTHYLLLISLFIISILDFTVLRDFYFDPPTWRNNLAKGNNAK